MKEYSLPEFVKKRSIVVCICGTLAAGKTTLIRSLSEHLEGSAVLVFDEYEQFGQWPQDFGQWIAEGCNPGEVTNSQLREDLQSLQSGCAICHPTGKHRIDPSPIILLEDPFGRTRPDNADLIDLVLFVDLPWDLSVVRMAQRALKLDDLASQGELTNVSKDDLIERIESARNWLFGYVARREMYTALSEPVRRSADVILDGMREPRAVLEDALAAINQGIGEITDKGVA
jgi:uridine kinase